MLVIHQDYKGNRLSDKQVINPVIRREVNGNDTLEFECKHGVFSREDVVLINYNEWYEYIVKDITETKWGARIYCENSIINLYSEYVDDVRVINGYPVEALTKILKGSLWSVGDVDTNVKTHDWNAYHVSAYQSLQSILNTWNLEVETEINVVGNKVSSRRIHLRRYIEKDYGERFEYKKNLKSVTRKILKDEIFTAVYGYGKGERTEGGGYGRRINFADINDGLKYVADEQARLTWGKPDYNSNLQHRFGVVIFSDCEDVAELKELTIDYLNSVNHPIIEYEVEAYDVDTALGNAVVVIDDDLGVELKARIVKDEYYPDEKRRNVTIGNYSPILSSLTSTVERKIDSKIEQNNQTTIEYIDLVRAEAIEAGSNKDAFIYNLRMGNEYGLPAGLYAFDRPIDENPTSATWSAAGYTYHSDSKNPDGTWNWTTITTPQGLAANTVGANQIIAGSISADHIDAQGIRADQIVAESGNDMETVINDMGITISDNTTIEGIPVSNKMGEVLDGMESMNARMDAFEEGGGNMLRNPTYGMPTQPDSAWWSDGNTYQELKARKVTWGVLKNNSKKWSDTKGGLV